MHYFPNSSLYPVGNYYRYIEYYYQKTHRVHQIKQIENSEYIQKILILAQKGVRFSELATTLVEDDITIEEAYEFIHELIDEQLLVSELEPAVTNVESLISLIDKIKKLPDLDSQIIDILSTIDIQLDNIDQQPIGTTVNIYSEIIKNIEKTKIDTEIKYLFQTDLFKPVKHATVSRNIFKSIQQVLVFLNKIISPVTETNLTRFKENFIKRYEHREMPLLFILDSELGIGYGNNTPGDINPLVDDLVKLQENSKSNAYQHSIHKVLLQKYQQSSQKIIELTDEDVKDVEAIWEDLPPTISVMCEILQDNEQGYSYYIKSAGGMSAAALLGRFSHLDKEILKHTLAITEKEAQMHPEVIFAEIVHLPESRVGNVLLRPVLRPYEIPYLAKTGVSKEFELRLNDLYVSIRNNRIVLYSKYLDKEIVPRMSNAHAFNEVKSMPVYNFLCDLQHQEGRAGLWFRWNETAKLLDYLPRIVYKNCILSKARWIVHDKEIKSFAGVDNDSELLMKVKEWQNVRQLPDIVLFVDGDNELYVDLNHPLSLRAWLSVVKKHSSFILEEFLFDPATAVVHGREGAFTNEFIFAFYNESLKKNI